QVRLLIGFGDLVAEIDSLAESVVERVFLILHRGVTRKQRVATDSTRTPSDPGLGERVEKRANRTREPRVSGLEPDRGALERVAVLTPGRLLARALEHPVYVAQHRFERRALVGIELPRAAQGLGQARAAAARHVSLCP